MVEDPVTAETTAPSKAPEQSHARPTAARPSDPSLETGAPEDSTNSSTIHGKAPLNALDQQHAVEQAEHVANFIRLRRGMMLGAFLWPGFTLADWVADAFVQPGILKILVVIRYSSWLVLLGLMSALYRRKDLSPQATRVAETFIFTLASASLTTMCVFFGGFGSIYFGGVILVLVCRGAFVVEPLRQGVVPQLLTVSAYPVVLLASTLIYPPTAAQLGEPAPMGSFLIYLCFIVAAAALTALSSHVMWSLRRQVFEARNIGRYRLEKRVGKGGMGEVWRAYDKNLRRDVALKILRPREGQSANAVTRFEREVKATIELSHPNTVRVFDFGVSEDGLWYYAMELLHGEPLGQVIRREGALELSRAVHIAGQAARALAEAHAAGIVHRDIKPGNLFITTLGGEKDFVKLLDFGIARMTEGDDDTLTATGQVAGTPGYIAPEVTTGKPADARADVYALGAVLYSMVAGQPPFSGPNPSATLIAHLHQQPAAMAARRGSPVPRALEAIVLRCLAKEPEKRFVDAQDLAVALAEVGTAVVEAPWPLATAVRGSLPPEPLGDTASTMTSEAHQLTAPAGQPED